MKVIKRFTAEIAEIAELRFDFQIYTCMTSAPSAISVVNANFDFLDRFESDGRDRGGEGKKGFG